MACAVCVWYVCHSWRVCGQRHIYHMPLVQRSVLQPQCNDQVIIHSIMMKSTMDPLMVYNVFSRNLDVIFMWPECPSSWFIMFIKCYEESYCKVVSQG